MPSLSQALLLEYLPSSHSAFQGHAAHTARWPAMLRPKGSWGACTPQGIIHSSTVLHGADLYTLWHSLHSSMPLSRRTAMHASCDSPWHSLAKRTRLGGLLPPQVAFQEHAAHPPRWPGELSSKGSSDTCISDSVSTFLYRAFTAHGAHLVRVHARFTFASFEARFNAGARFDHACQFRQQRFLQLYLGHTRRGEVILVAIPSVPIGGIPRCLGL